MTNPHLLTQIIKGLLHKSPTNSLEVNIQSLPLRELSIMVVEENTVMIFWEDKDDICERCGDRANRDTMSDKEVGYKDIMVCNKCKGEIREEMMNQYVRQYHTDIHNKRRLAKNDAP